MSYLRYLCMFAHSGVQHILCCGFGLFVFVLCLVYVASFSGLSIFECPSVFSNIYIRHSRMFLFYLVITELQLSLYQPYESK